MKSKLILCSMVLGCSMGLIAQQSSTAPGATPGTTPPTFPQDQSQQQQVGSQPGQVGSQPSSAPTAADDQMGQQSSQAGQMGSSQKQQVEGCLSGTDGNFTLTDKAGATYQLQGENSELAKHVGQEVRIEGMASAAGSASAASSNAASPSGASSESTLTVSKVKKVSNTCSSGSASPSTPKQ